MQNGDRPRKATGMKYDRHLLLHANSFDNRFQSGVVSSTEWVTGKIPFHRMIRQFEGMGAPGGLEIRRTCPDLMGIRFEIPRRQIENIPAEGPGVVFVSQPPGLGFAKMIGKRRATGNAQMLTLSDDPRAFMTWLHEHILALKE